MLIRDLLIRLGLLKPKYKLHVEISCSFKHKTHDSYRVYPEDTRPLDIYCSHCGRFLVCRNYRIHNRRELLVVGSHIVKFMHTRK